MYALASRLTDLPILSLQTGQPVSTLGQPILDPDRLQIQAFFCNHKSSWLERLFGSAPNTRNGSAVLLIRDIRQLSPDGVLIDSAEDIEDAGEIIRLKELIDRRFVLNKCRVETESGTYLGSVEDFSIGVDDFQIHKLYVRQTILKNLLLDNLTIDRNQVVDVSQRRIVVRDAHVKQPSLAPSPLSPE